ncbi:HdeD family acid-resistance protein [Corynebacterium sp.]|uniref:HdeD family acid-resistance protein n=1 Tax=Corynebacterium sp. TaxID=1720 RepID=UPI003B3A4067
MSSLSTSLRSSLLRRGARFLLWRGIVGVVMGLLLIFFPFSSAIVMSLFVGAWMIVDGLVASGQAVDLKKAGAPWGWTLAEGVISIVAGIAILLLPGIFAVVSSFFIIGFLALGLVVSGVTQLSVPRTLRTGWTVAAGVLNVVFSVLLGVLAVLNPVDNVWTLAWVAGVYALILGISTIVISVRMRRSGQMDA